MKIAKMFKTALQQALSMFVVSNRAYLVFRRYRQIQPNILDYKSIKNVPDPKTWVVEESFALHFVESFKSKNSAQKAIDFAKQLEPWQEFVILHGCLTN